MTVSAGDFYSLFWFNLLMKGLKALLTDETIVRDPDVTKQIYT